MLGGFQSPGGRIWGFRRDGGRCAESPAGVEELAGAEKISCAEAEEIAGAMAIASAGVSI